MLHRYGASVNGSSVFDEGYLDFPHTNFFAACKDLTAMRRRGPQNADLNGHFRASRVILFIEPPARRSNSSSSSNSARLIKTLPTNVMHRRAVRPTRIFVIWQSLYLRFRLRVVNACVFLKSALGCPERCQNKGLASRSSRMRTAVLCLSACRDGRSKADKSGLRVLTPGSDKVDFVALGTAFGRRLKRTAAR